MYANVGYVHSPAAVSGLIKVSSGLWSLFPVLPRWWRGGIFINVCPAFREIKEDREPLLYLLLLSCLQFKIIFLPKWHVLECRILLPFSNILQNIVNSLSECRHWHSQNSEQFHQHKILSFVLSNLLPFFLSQKQPVPFPFLNAVVSRTLYK